MLQPELYTESFGDASQRCLKEAFHHWWTDHAKGSSKEVAYAELITDMSFTAKFRRAGVVEVTVHISGKKAKDNEAYYFRYQRETAGLMRRMESVKA